MIEIPNSLPTKAINIVFPPNKSPNVQAVTGKFQTRSLGSMDIPTCKPTKQLLLLANIQESSHNQYKQMIYKLLHYLFHCCKNITKISLNIN